MLARVRSDAWRRRGFWFRGVGLLLLLAALFVPGGWGVPLAVAGLSALTLGALVWLLRDSEPWRR